MRSPETSLGGMAAVAIGELLPDLQVEGEEA